MTERILEKTGVDNTNIDGAVFNRFCAGSRDGILKGVLNECAASIQGNAFTLSTGELLISGFRTVIESPVVKTFATPPVAAVTYQVVGEIKVSAASDVQFTLKFQEVQQLVQEDLFETSTGEGTYQVEICRFVQGTDGNLSSLSATMKTISGGSQASITVGNVVTETLGAGSNASVEVKERETEDTVYTDFKFQIPQGSSGSNGTDGKDALVCNVLFNSTFTVGSTLIASESSFNRTPVIGENFVAFNKNNQYAIFNVDSYGAQSTLFVVKPTTVVNTKGAQGSTGLTALEYNDTYTEEYEGDIADEPISLPISGFNRTPVVGDIFLLVYNVTESGNSYIAPFTITEVGITTVKASLDGALSSKISGEKGADGQDALVYNTLINSTFVIGSSITLSQANFNRAPAVGENFVGFSTANQYAILNVYGIGTSSNIYVKPIKLVSTKGANGSNGTNGTDGAQTVVYNSNNAIVVSSVAKDATFSLATSLLTGANTIKVGDSCILPLATSSSATVLSYVCQITAIANNTATFKITSGIPIAPAPATNNLKLVYIVNTSDSHYEISIQVFTNYQTYSDIIRQINSSSFFYPANGTIKYESDTYLVYGIGYLSENVENSTIKCVKLGTGELTDIEFTGQDWTIDEVLDS